MKHIGSSRHTTRWAAAVIFAGLWLGACDNEIRFEPVGPSPPLWTSNLGELRTLQISGILTSEDGTCLEATILYDGRELPGARVACAHADGCARVELSGVTSSASGHHTIAFKVLRQSSTRAGYRGEGTIRVKRNGFDWEVTIPLASARATLRSGEAVTFDIDFDDSLW